jgi:hypothetical protein
MTNALAALVARIADAAKAGAKQSALPAAEGLKK